MQIGHLGKLLGNQSAIKCVKSAHTMILLGEIGLHEINIGRQIVEQGASELTAKHRDAYIGILLSQRPDYRHHHGHIAKS